MGSLNRVTSRRYWVVLFKSGRGGQGGRLVLFKSEDQRGEPVRTISLDIVSLSLSTLSSSPSSLLFSPSQLSCSLVLCSLHFHPLTLCIVWSSHTPPPSHPSLHFLPQSPPPPHHHHHHHSSYNFLRSPNTCAYTCTLVVTSFHIISPFTHFYLSVLFL